MTAWTATFDASRSWCEKYILAWDSFWFTPRLPHTLCALRVVTGLMILYSHLVLATDLSSFLGDQAWVNNETARKLHDGAFGFSDYGRSYLWFISNPLLLWLHHAFTLLVTAAFAVGFLTRITAPMTWLLLLMYLHRMTGALFGFDQIITYSAMYLMLAPCGARFSVDAWIRERIADRRAASRGLQWLLPDARPSVAACVATRLFQLHICVIYMFGGLSKARGTSWWDGTAMWYSVGNYEYQSIDMTWIAGYPLFFTAMTHITLFWEIFYCALIWPKRTRPIMLAGAVGVHGGIAMFLGMITFGLMMIAANMVFLRPEIVARLAKRLGSTHDESDERENDTVSALVPGEPTEDAGDSDHVVAERGDEQDGSIGERENRLRLASRRLRTKRSKLIEREQLYRERVSRLREREAKIQKLVERRRELKARKASQEQEPQQDQGEQ